MILRDADELVEAMRARRRELGLTQEELANLAGIHRTQVVLYEKGERTFRVDVALRLLHALGMDLELRTRGR
ncbi:MAG TPA: helix-turn-helix transcriptional regulator [Solirubrobacteraceae bacterium]|nr:helix-turn-helix transcriptional regulator [Solirubrobacteraceae bacterium]